MKTPAEIQKHFNILNGLLINENSPEGIRSYQGQLRALTWVMTDDVPKAGEQVVDPEPKGKLHTTTRPPVKKNG